MNFKEIAAYSLGLFGFQAIVGLLNSYQAEFDASILGADIAVVGILVLVAKILSAVFDPFVGNMIDRSKSKNGKFKSMIAKSILPLLAMSAVVFFAYAVVPGILSLLSAIPIFKYDIVGKKKQEISDALQARRTAAAAEK